jgi:hypothetical protein
VIIALVAVGGVLAGVVGTLLVVGIILAKGFRW